MKIKTGRVEETLGIGDNVLVTVISVEPSQICLAIVAPQDMIISTEAHRHELIESAGVRMGSWRVGMTVNIGPDIAVMILDTLERRVRLGIFAPQEFPIRSAFFTPSPWGRGLSSTPMPGKTDSRHTHLEAKT